MMTKKDYVRVAEILKAQKDYYKKQDDAGAGKLAIENVQHCLAVLFRDDNPRFDRSRFDKACE